MFVPYKIPWTGNRHAKTIGDDGWRTTIPEMSEDQLWHLFRIGIDEYESIGPPNDHELDDMKKEVDDLMFEDIDRPVYANDE